MLAQLKGRRLRQFQIDARKRRDSLRGYPDLHQTHRVPVGGSLDAGDSFPSATRRVTFKLRVDADASEVYPFGSTGVLLDTGAGSVGFVLGRLRLIFNGSAVEGPFVGAPKASAEVVVALHPQTGEVRAWVDSELSVAGNVGAGFAWHDGATFQYSAGFGGVTPSHDLDAFYGQLPRHFLGEVEQAAPAFDEVLYRSTRQAADQASAHVPFLDLPDYP